VVIRYFGGVKLGTGGLMQAYKAAAKDAVENGIIIVKTWTVKLEIRFDYRHMNDVMRIIKDENLRIIRQDSSEKCCILLEIRKGNIYTIKNKFSLVEMLDYTVI
jgi:putative IMPACT (imprinted ancient) family translation regulator